MSLVLTHVKAFF